MTDNQLAAGWRVYIVQCADGSLYTGITTNIEQRIAEHNEGGKRGARYTRARRPVRLVYQRSCADRAAAATEEARIKKLARRDKLALIAGPDQGG